MQDIGFFYLKVIVVDGVKTSQELAAYSPFQSCYLHLKHKTAGKPGAVSISVEGN